MVNRSKRRAKNLAEQREESKEETSRVNVDMERESNPSISDNGIEDQYEANIDKSHGSGGESDSDDLDYGKYDRRFSTISYKGQELKKQSMSIKAVDAPILKQFNRLAIVNFNEKRRKYENHCVQYDARPVTIKEMIDRKVIRSICTIELSDTTPDKVTPEELENVIEKYMHHSKELGKTLEEEFEEIRMSFKHVDPTTRVHEYSAVVDDMLTRNGWYDDYYSEDSTLLMRKDIIKCLLKGVRPSSVKVLVWENMKKMPAKESSNVGVFWKTLHKIVMDQDIFGKKRGRNPSKKDEYEPRSKYRRGDRYYSSTGKYREDSNRSLNMRQAKFKRKLQCFGCKGEHTLQACTKYNDDQKREIITKLRLEWKKNRDEKSKMQ